MSDILIARNTITAVVLAGGKARRMGGEDKGLCMLNGKAMIQYVLENLSRQVKDIVINANRNHEIYSKYGCPVISDDYPDFCGPLAGVASSMRLADNPMLMTCPCDTPFMPIDLVERLYLTLIKSNANISVAHNGRRLQPVFAMIKISLYDSLHEYLMSGHRKIDRWFSQEGYVETDFSDCPDAFDNINTPEDIARNEQRLKER